MPESWNHASLPLRACAGPLAAAYVYRRARVTVCASVQGERSSGIPVHAVPAYVSRVRTNVRRVRTNGSR